MRSFSDLTMTNWNGIEVGSLRAVPLLRQLDTGSARR